MAPRSTEARCPVLFPGRENGCPWINLAVQRAAYGGIGLMPACITVSYTAEGRLLGVLYLGELSRGQPAYNSRSSLAAASCKLRV